jgi:hypothetical protein
MKPIADSLYSDQPSETLYHYTSLTALQSIIEDQGLWATDIHYFDDSAELAYTAQLLANEIQRRSANRVGDRSIQDQLLQWVRERVANGRILFVASLTSNGNLLSQWRSYCSYGNGISLGFPAEHVRNCAQEQSYSVARCVYDAPYQRRVIQETVEAIEAIALSRGPAPTSQVHPSHSYHPAFTECEDDILRIAAVFKNPAFTEEAEWRIVSPTVSDYVHTDISYRVGRSTLVWALASRVRR